MKIYQVEKDCKLEEVIVASTAVAVEADASSIDPSIDCSVARDMLNRIDVSRGHALFTSILTSVGWNANDDVFSRGETYRAYPTAAKCPVSVEHLTSEFEDSNTTCGFIVESLPLTSSLQFCECEDTFEHIITSMYVWADYWPHVTSSVIEKLAQGTARVSMECKIKDFGYALRGSDGQIKLLERNDKTAVLTSYLRRYGGPGKVKINGEMYDLGRWLKDLSFSGISFVENPANKRSIVFKDYIVASNELDSLGENLPSVYDSEELIMAKESDNKVVASEGVDAAVQAAQAEVAAMTDKVKSMEDQVKCMQTEAAEMQDKVKCAEQAAKDMESKCSTLASEVASKDKAIAELQAKIDAMEKAKMVQCRMTVASELNLPYTEDKVASMSVETWDAVVELAKASVKQAEPAVDVKDIKVDNKSEADIVAASLTSEGTKPMTLADAMSKAYNKTKKK